MRPNASVFRFVSVADRERVGRLVCAGRAEAAQRGGGTSADGLWREVDRPDGGVLFLLIDVEGKGHGANLLRELIEQVLDDPRTWGKCPGELLVELHSLAGAQWAETERTFVAQAVLVFPEGDHYLVASAGIPLPWHAAAGPRWRSLDLPGESIGFLGRPDIHAEGEPVFPDLRVDLRAVHRYLAVTDGITEAGRPRVLGAAVVLTLLNSLPGGLEPDAILDAVFALAAQHDGPSWPGDDVTGLCWRLDGPS
jgi:hypothetical protein